MSGFYIGNVRIEGDLALGPMAGVTDMPFRTICKEFGADLLYTEMISAKGIYYKNKNTEPLWQIDDIEHPIALQLFGSEPELMADMAQQIEERNFDILDINMGCPVPKVVNNGEGSALMKTPKLAAKIVRTISDRIEKPITVKFRKGFNDDNINAVEFAKMMEQSGASAVAVHGRTREEYYSGMADWDIIKKVKDSVKIPVIASGDIFTLKDYIKCKNETGCDCIMIARGARGNPWIFRQIKEYQKSGKEPENPEFSEVTDMILRHAKLLIEFKGEYLGIREMRKHVGWYTAGYKNSSSIRRKMNEVETYEQLKQLITNYSDK